MQAVAQQSVPQGVLQHGALPSGHPGLHRAMPEMLTAGAGLPEHLQARQQDQHTGEERYRKFITDFHNFLQASSSGLMSPSGRSTTGWRTGRWRAARSCPSRPALDRGSSRTCTTTSTASSAWPGSRLPPPPIQVGGGAKLSRAVSLTVGFSGEEDDERDYDGKRPGAPMNGLASKKRRKQSKPIRLGNEGELGEQEEGGGDVEGEEEYGEECSSPAGVSSPQGDAPLNLSGGPLNLSAPARPIGVDERGEQGGLRVLGRELLMQHPEQVQEGNRMPNRGSNLFPEAAFNMPHFMFPSMSSQPSSMSRAEMEQGFTPLHTGDRPQIFNIEAYCKLCNKEFCNKYFLKTHMANKHGIYSDPPPTTSSNGSGPRFEGGALPSSMSIGPPPTSMYDRNARFPYTSSPMNISLPTTPVSFSGSFTASMRPTWSSDCPPSPRLPMPPSLVPQTPLPPQQSPGRGSEGSHSRPHSNTGLRSPLPSPSMRPQSQGPDERATPNSLSPKAGPPPLIPGRPYSERSEGEAGEKELETGEEKGELRMGELVMPKLDNLPPGIRLPMVPSLNPFGPLPFFNLSPMSPMDALRKEEGKHRDMLNIPGLQSIPKIPSLPRKPGDSPGSKGNMNPDNLRRMGVINADAFCEYCCKEFCNKYFLRVHKLKKHGVCSPELPPEKVQKILAQMAKEAGKTGQPMPPLTLGSPSVSRPPGSAGDSPRPLCGPLAGALSSPLNLIRPPMLPNFLNLPPLDPLPPYMRDDERSSSSSDKGPDEREEGKSVNLQCSPFSSMMEPECELKIDESAGVIKSPLPEGPREQSESSEDHEQKSLDGNRVTADQHSKPEDASEGLANLQNMIMKLNHTKPRAAESTTICKICNKDMENKYFLHAHMMNEHGVLHVEDDSIRRSPNPPISLPQYPADLSKLGIALTIPSPGLLSRPPPLTSLANGFSKLSEKPLDFPKNIFEQMQGLPRPSFLDQMKKELGGSIDIPLSPLKRPLDRDPNKKPASLSRSYCEICKKELCNKYFMKTHMMKMHGIMMEPGPPGGGISCDICKKELSSRYFLKVHMANGHGLNEDGSPIPPHLRESGLMSMFPMGDLPPPPPMGEFSRLLMQQGEKNMERLKELDRQKSQETNGQHGHICSLCSNSFPDIIALQVHIIKNHGALPPTTGIESLFNRSLDKERVKDGETAEKSDEDAMDKDGEDREDSIADKYSEDNLKDNTQLPFPPPPFGFPLDLAKMMGAPGGKGLPGGPLGDLLARQTGGPMAGLPGLPGLPPAGNPQFQGLFNMFLSEMLKKVQKETPPQTPPSSPGPLEIQEQEQDTEQEPEQELDQEREHEVEQEREPATEPAQEPEQETEQEPEREGVEEMQEHHVVMQEHHVAMMEHHVPMMDSPSLPRAPEELTS